MIAGEGNYPFIYLDSRGFPTYGVGHLIYRTDQGDAEKELMIFIDLCSSLRVVVKRDKGKGEPATQDDIKAEVRNLIGIGQNKIRGYEERRAKALKHIHPTAFVSSATPPAQSSVQTLGTALHDVLDFSELQTATKLASKKYNNLDVPHFWSKQATLYTDAADTQLMLQNDIENLVLLPLKRGGPWGQKTGDLPEPIQTIVIDIVFNAGIKNRPTYSPARTNNRPGRRSALRGAAARR